MANLKFDFSGRKALITGGAGGIGRQTVKDFLAAGAEAAVWDVSEEGLRRLESELKSPRLEARRVDVSSFEQCRKAAAALKSPIDFLIGGAGVLRDRSLAKMTEGEYQSVIQANLSGMFFAAKALLPHFRQGAGGKRIVNISSISGLCGGFGQTSYAAAKAGAIAFAKVWARELAKKGFTANAIAPGFVQTDMLKGIPPEIMGGLLERIPLGRLGRPEEISKTILFLCSREASYINGAVLEVSGGASF